MDEEGGRYFDGYPFRSDVVLASGIRARLRKYIALRGGNAYAAVEVAEEMRCDAYRLETKEAAGIRRHLLEYFGAAGTAPERSAEERQALKDAVDKFISEHAGDSQGI